MLFSKLRTQSPNLTTANFCLLSLATFSGNDDFEEDNGLKASAEINKPKGRAHFLIIKQSVSGFSLQLENPSGAEVSLRK